MNAAEAIEIGRSALITLLKIGSPIMAVALIVGLAIALFQALTQIQEMTLTFVPKIVAIFFTLMLLLPFMISTLTAYAQELFDKIASG